MPAMLVRRAAGWIATAAVAVLVALAVPVLQVRVIASDPCCCPDPDRCHCPDHEPGPSQQPTIRACHNPERTVAAPELPVFAAPQAPVATVPAISVRVIDREHPAPLPAPQPRRPDAPS